VEGAHGEHDRIATAGKGRTVKVYDGKALTLLHDLQLNRGVIVRRAFESAEGPHRLLVAAGRHAPLPQVWDPEEGRLLHDNINSNCPLEDWHLLESEQGRHLVVLSVRASGHPRHPTGAVRTFLDVWDLGGAPARAQPLRPAHHLG
jgi:hypothetical protein